VTRLSVLLVVAALAGCAQDVNGLAPFPCSRAGDCPSGLACIASVCTPPRLYAACQATTDCTRAAPGTACVGGLCAPSCQDGAGCAADKVCSTPSGAGACLVACDLATTVCPAALVCAPLYGGRRGCASGPTSGSGTWVLEQGGIESAEAGIGAGVLMLVEAGFEKADTTCEPNGLCVTGGIAP
jgi:hypothetical protein